MFEKEAEEYLKKDGTKAEQILSLMQGKIKVTIKQIPFILAAFQQIFIDGAEFGYNKGNEWHYVKDGDLPPEDTKVLALMAEKEICIAHFYRRNVWDKIETVIAWKEIVPPKEIKENE